MCVTVITFLCPFQLESPRLNLKLLWKTWDILVSTYLIALLHISNESTAYLFEISRYIKYLDTRTKHLLCGLRGVRLISYISHWNEVGHPRFILRLLDSLMICNIWKKFETNLSWVFFQGNDLKSTNGCTSINFNEHITFVEYGRSRLLSSSSTDNYWSPSSTPLFPSDILGLLLQPYYQTLELLKLSKIHLPPALVAVILQAISAVHAGILTISTFDVRCTHSWTVQYLPSVSVIASSSSSWHLLGVTWLLLVVLHTYMHPYIHTYWSIHFRCSQWGFSATCLQQMQGSVVEGLSQTAISSSQWYFVWDIKLCPSADDSPQHRH